MRISVAIINWNTREMLRECLTSLTLNTGSGASIELVVVDNGSADGSADMVAASFPTVSLIRNDENLGFSKAVNQAFSISTGDYFLLFNSDAYVEDDTLTDCGVFLDEHPQFSILGCRVTYPDGSHQSSCFRFSSLRGIVLNSLYLSQVFRTSYFLNWDRYGHADWTKPREVDCVMGGFLMVRRSVIEAGDLLDSGYFMYGEEKDLCYRLFMRGLKTVYYPSAKVVHLHSGSSRRRPEVSAWVYEMKRRAILRFLWKWRGPTVAWLANMIMTIDLFPRGLIWGVGDIAAVILRKGSGPDRILRLRVLRFHLAAIFAPSMFAREWGPDH
ncbi:MAG: glycosyltransferase family 2 protein [Pseudomonadota bacterium]